MHDTQDSGKLAPHAPPAMQQDVPERDDATTARDNVAAQAPSLRPHGQPHALVVDDEADILDVLVMLLNEDGFRASACSTPEAAMDVLRTEPVQLLITDLRLAGSDGLDLIRYAQQLEAGPPPVILLTAARLPGLQQESPLLQETGARIVTKPFDIDQLLAVAREMTGWHGLPED